MSSNKHKINNNGAPSSFYGGGFGTSMQHGFGYKNDLSDAMHNENSLILPSQHSMRDQWNDNQIANFLGNSQAQVGGAGGGFGNNGIPTLQRTQSSSSLFQKFIQQKSSNSNLLPLDSKTQGVGGFNDNYMTSSFLGFPQTASSTNLGGIGSEVGPLNGGGIGAGINPGVAPSLISPRPQLQNLVSSDSTGVFGFGLAQQPSSRNQSPYLKPYQQQFHNHHQLQQHQIFGSGGNGGISHHLTFENNQNKNSGGTQGQAAGYHLLSEHHPDFHQGSSFGVAGGLGLNTGGVGAGGAGGGFTSLSHQQSSEKPHFNNNNYSES